MIKALQEKSPAIFFRRMVKFNVGRTFLPELFLMTEIPAGPATHHPEGDLFTHSIEVLQRMADMSPEMVPRFCALFHDLGKFATPPDQYPRHISHDEAGSAMAPQFCNRLKLPDSIRKSLMYTCKLHLTAGRWNELRDSSKVKLAREAIKGGISSFLRQIILADHSLNYAMQGWETAIQAASLASKELGINPDLLSGNTALPANKRASLIHQHQVERFRLLLSSKQ
jgi:tRNA nucleotidyltransferase (CCA-adding enzyme)